MPRSYQLFRCQILPLIAVTRRIGNFSDQGIIGRSSPRQINLGMAISIPARAFKVGLYVRVLEMVALAGKRLVQAMQSSAGVRFRASSSPLEYSLALESANTYPLAS